jgi:hypothetical protein
MTKLLTCLILSFLILTTELFAAEMPSWLTETTDVAAVDNTSDHTNPLTDAPIAAAETSNLGPASLQSNANVGVDVDVTVDTTSVVAPLTWNEEFARVEWDKAVVERPWYQDIASYEAPVEANGVFEQINDVTSFVTHVGIDGVLFGLRVASHLGKLELTAFKNELATLQTPLLCIGLKGGNSFRKTYLGVASMLYCAYQFNMAMSGIYCVFDLIRHPQGILFGQNYSSNTAVQLCLAMLEVTFMHYLLNQFEIFEKPYAMDALRSQFSPIPADSFTEMEHAANANVTNPILKQLFFNHEVTSDHPYTDAEIQEIGEYHFQRLALKGAKRSKNEQKTYDEVMTHPTVQRKLGLLRVGDDKRDFFSFFKNVLNFHSKKTKKMHEEIKRIDRIIIDLFESNDDPMILSLQKYVYSMPVSDQSLIAQSLCAIRAKQLQEQHFSDNIEPFSAVLLRESKGYIEEYLNNLVEEERIKQDEADCLNQWGGNGASSWRTGVDNFSERFIAKGFSPSEVKRIARANKDFLREKQYFKRLSDPAIASAIEMQKQREIVALTELIKTAKRDFFFASLFMNFQELCEPLEWDMMTEELAQQDARVEDMVIQESGGALKDVLNSYLNNLGYNSGQQEALRKVFYAKISSFCKNKKVAAADVDKQILQSFKQSNDLDILYAHPYNHETSAAIASEQTNKINAIVAALAVESPAQHIWKLYRNHGGNSTLGAFLSHHKVLWQKTHDYKRNKLENEHAFTHLNKGTLEPEVAEKGMTVSQKHFSISQAEILYCMSKKEDTAEILSYTYRDVIYEIEKEKKLLHKR